MHTWKIYDYSRTKTAAILIYSFYFRSCATTSPMRIAIIHSVPPAFSLNFMVQNILSCFRKSESEQQIYAVSYFCKQHC